MGRLPRSLKGGRQGLSALKSTLCASHQRPAGINRSFEAGLGGVFCLERASAFRSAAVPASTRLIAVADSPETTPFVLGSSRLWLRPKACTGVSALSSLTGGALLSYPAGGV